MIVIIHQPYFLPWLGYFSKLPFADKFVILDNVHFTKGFYLDRTKYINVDGDVKWLSIPSGQHFQIDINKITISDKSFVAKVIKTIEYNYAKADFYKAEWPVMKEIIIDCLNNNQKLVDINISLIKNISSFLDINQPEYILSSEFGDFSNKTERIISLCKKVNVNEIIIGGGNSVKEHDWEIVEKNGISVLLQDYYNYHPIYKQIRRQRVGFQKGVSILDCILNIGKQQTKEYISNTSLKPNKISFK